MASFPIGMTPCFLQIESAQGSLARKSPAGRMTQLTSKLLSRSANPCLLMYWSIETRVRQTLNGKRAEPRPGYGWCKNRPFFVKKSQIWIVLANDCQFCYPVLSRANQAGINWRRLRLTNRKITLICWENYSVLHPIVWSLMHTARVYIIPAPKSRHNQK